MKSNQKPMRQLNSEFRFFCKEIDLYRRSNIFFRDAFTSLIYARLLGFGRKGDLAETGPSNLNHFMSH